MLHVIMPTKELQGHRDKEYLLFGCGIISILTDNCPKEIAEKYKKNDENFVKEYKEFGARHYVFFDDGSYPPKEDSES